MFFDENSGNAFLAQKAKLKNNQKRNSVKKCVFAGCELYADKGGDGTMCKQHMKSSPKNKNGGEANFMDACNDFVPLSASLSETCRYCKQSKSDHVIISSPSGKEQAVFNPNKGVTVVKLHLGDIMKRAEEDEERDGVGPLSGRAAPSQEIEEEMRRFQFQERENKSPMTPNSAARFNEQEYTNHIVKLDDDKGVIKVATALDEVSKFGGESPGGDAVKRRQVKRGLEYMAQMSELRGNTEIRQEADQMLAYRLQEDEMLDVEKKKTVQKEEEDRRARDDAAVAKTLQTIEMEERNKKMQEIQMKKMETQRRLLEQEALGLHLKPPNDKSPLLPGERLFVCVRCSAQIVIPPDMRNFNCPACGTAYKFEKKADEHSPPLSQREMESKHQKSHSSGAIPPTQPARAISPTRPQQPQQQQSSSASTWSCSLCTYQNKLASNKCEMCETIRPESSSSASQAKPSTPSSASGGGGDIPSPLASPNQRVASPGRGRPGGVEKAASARALTEKEKNDGMQEHWGAEVFDNDIAAGVDQVDVKERQTRHMKIVLNPDGTKFTKMGRKGKPHQRVIIVSDKDKFITWGSGKMMLNTVLRVEAGKKTDVFTKNPYNKDASATLCFSLITRDRSLDLQAQTTTQRDDWVACLKQLVTKSKGL